MSREIKFRAWHAQLKKMYGVSRLYFYPDGRLKVIYPLCSLEETITDSNDFVLMQFTGMQDKNGREIYEGDILKIEDATAQVVFWERPPEFGLNFYHNEDVWCEDWNLTDDSDRMEIVGNIYENPDLVAIS